MDLAAYKTYYMDKLHELTKKFLREEVQLSQTERCCVSMRQHQFSVLAIDTVTGTNTIQYENQFKFDDENALKLILSGAAQRSQLQTVPVTWLLHPSNYDLNLIDSMPVPKNELKTALTWRVRSLLKYPVEEAALEYFELPPKKSAPNAPLIAAVTAPKKTLQNYVNILNQCGMHLVNITIPELAMLNLSSLYEDNEKNSAFLYFYDSSMILNITSRKTLYFTRRITVPYTAESQIDYEKICLEILRYFDFFCSQWRASSPSQIFVSTESGDASLLAKALTERLLNPVEAYTLKGTLINQTDIEKVNAHYLLNYGALLANSGGVNAAAGN